MTAQDVLRGLYPEIGAGGFSRLDGTIEFYTRINALIDPAWQVLDFGAGRAAWFEDDTSAYRRQLRLLRGKVAKVVACDVDDAVLMNRAADEVVHVPQARLPFPDQSFDLIVADYVFEHVVDPDVTVAELGRVLKRGGWLCARTPNKFGYVAVASRLIANGRHARLLQWIQPGRKVQDVFPTAYLLNSLTAVRRHFPGAAYEDFSYRYEAEPQYFFGKAWICILLRFVHAILPPPLSSSLHIVLRKR